MRTNSDAGYLTRRFETGEARELSSGEPINRYYTREDAVDDMPNEGGGVFDLLGRLVAYVAPRPNQPPSNY